MSVRTRSVSAGASIVAALAAIALTLSLGAGSAGAQALTLEPASFGAEVGNQFCANLVVSGASDPDNLTFSLDSGTLPAGIVDPAEESFGAVDPESRWRLAGTPTTVGSATFVIEVVDDLGTLPTGDDVSDTASFTIEVIEESDADIVIAAGREATGYTIDCSSQAQGEVQGFARDLANFGPSGTVASRLAIRDDIDPIDDAYLTGVDVLLDGWVNDGEWETGELARIEAWVEAGGVLIAAEDHSAADALGATFGAPTSDQALCTHTPSETGDPIGPCPAFAAADDNHPVVDGPFGDWSSTPLATSGTVGWYETDPADWQVIARDSSARATVITRRVELGRVILVTDEGLWRTQSFPTAGNRTFVGNLLAYAIDPFGQPELVDDVVDGAVGEPLSADLCANDVSLGDTPVDIAITAGTLPDGLSLDVCTIEGTPTVAAAVTLTYQVTDADDDTGTAEVELTITGDGPTCGGQPATIVGTPGDDLIIGTPGGDVIVARGGDDVIRGLAGNDIICGGRGDDVIIGGTGNDRLFGNAGNDVLRGRAGNDRLFGNRGADQLAGNAGDNDRCVGGLGPDEFLGGCEIEIR